jgi:hypothetical protein
MRAGLEPGSTAALDSAELFWVAERVDEIRLLAFCPV